jgi:hypothetical protein
VRTSLAWYALAVALVFAYVNTFAVWQLLQLRFGSGAALVPWLLAAVLAIGIVAIWRRGLRHGTVSPSLLLAALVVALAGMLLADPDYPAKRVHVPQYAVLAAVIWAALRPHVAAGRLAVLTILVGGLFGVHDEFLQGLHGDRTFGTRDMAVNLCGGIAGTFALAALTGRRVFTAEAVALPATVISGGLMSAVGLALYVAALAGLHAQPIPYWTTLPLLAGVFALACALVHDDTAADLRHAGTVVALLLIVLSFYPIVANETPLDFA